MIAPEQTTASYGRTGTIGAGDDGLGVQAYEADSRLASTSRHRAHRISSSCHAGHNSGEDVTLCGTAASIIGESESSPPVQSETPREMPNDATSPNKENNSSRCDDRKTAGISQAIELTCESSGKHMINATSESHPIQLESQDHNENRRAVNRCDDVNSSWSNIEPIHIPVSEPSVPVTDLDLRENDKRSSSNTQVNEADIKPTSLVDPNDHSLNTYTPPESPTSIQYATQPGAIAVSGIRANERNRRGDQSSSESSSFNVTSEDNALAQVIATPVVPEMVPTLSAIPLDVHSRESDQPERLVQQRRMGKHTMAAIVFLCTIIVIAVVFPVSLHITRRSTTTSSPPRRPETLDCDVENPEWIGDGDCNGDEYNTEDCGWDGGDCIEFNELYPNCRVEHPSNVGNGYCNGVSYNTEECGWDGGDCVEFNELYPNCRVDYPERVGNGYCSDDGYNTEDCGYDGGDCCEESCKARLYASQQCEGPWYRCVDPKYSWPT